MQLPDHFGTAALARYQTAGTLSQSNLEATLEPDELRIEEADMRELVERLVRVGAPQTLDTLTDWYIGIVIERIAGEQGR